MKLIELYELAVKKGMEHDPRTKQEIKKELYWGSGAQCSAGLKSDGSGNPVPGRYENATA